MKKVTLLCFTFLLVVINFIHAADKEFVSTNDKIIGHPRLLMLKGEEKVLLKRIAKDAYWQKIHSKIIEESNLMLQLPVNEKVMDGRRMLAVSRENIRRIFYLSYSYRMTKNLKYAQRAEKEMLKAASFNNWNPSHFLDVAEMTTAMAIGYDWLFDYLTPQSRNLIQVAIVDKGLNPSSKPEIKHWLNCNHNWNQVCNGGITLGALAVYEDMPQLSASLINRAINSIKIEMNEYAPDGVYPEGPSYWEYGTSYNVLFLSALEKVYNNDFSLTQLPGFLQTGIFSQQLIGPLSTQYNYSDNGKNGGFSPAIFWFYSKTKNLDLLYSQQKLIDNEDFELSKNRLLPAAIIWGVGSNASLDKVIEPEVKAWKGNGLNPVAVFRNSWSNRNAIFLGLKAGSASINHAHMDVGSFILDADSVHWAVDLGQENYGRLEGQGVSIWDTQRWDVFRYNNLSHNLLIINKKPQTISAKAEIENFGDKPDLMFATTDLTSIHKDNAKSVKRAVALIDKSYVLVEDEIETLSQYTKIRWNMATMADQMIPVSDNVILLKKGNKKMYMVVQTGVKIEFKTWSAQSENSYDSPNPNVQFVGFEAEMPLGKKSNIKVFLIPGELKTSLFAGSLL
jgi:hypothetical protein